MHFKSLHFHAFIHRQWLPPLHLNAEVLITVDGYGEGRVATSSISE